jgi:hypothetical protein
MDIFIKDSQIHEKNGGELGAIIAYPPILVDDMLACQPIYV